MIKVNKLLLILTCSFAFGLYQPECSAGIFKKKKKIKKLAEEIQEEEKAGRALDQSTNTQLKTMQYNCDKLVEELKSIPYVYLDGKKSSFDEITG